MNRRNLLASGLGVLATPAMAKSRGVRVTLLGQALIEHAATTATWPAFDAFAARLSRADVCFTNLETVIRGSHAEAPTREALTLHAGEPAVLGTLERLGVKLVGTANNHAFDLGGGGILDTLAALKAAGIASAGSGRDLPGAAAPGFIETPAGLVALVAFATGKIREGGMATASRPGVNELRREASGVPLAEDLARILDAIADARRRADVVIACQHNHDWEPDMASVPAWQRALARRCVDAGTSAFVGHGAPVFQAIEQYRGAPLFYGLGNFIFQTEKPPGAYPPEAWRGAVVECEFRRGAPAQVRLVPIVLNEIGLGGPQDMATRGFPTFAAHAQKQAFWNAASRLSAAIGSPVSFDANGQARF